jgi:beta-lactam-binding protein with PASTA domain
VVPKLKGKTLRTAKRALRKAHCRSGKISYRYSRRKKGQVISQRPHPRSELRNGARVKLVVSKGRRR